MAKLVIDCDPGHDDAVAILFAARHHDVLGITTVHGNAGLAQTTRNALRILTLAGLNIPVAAGCAEPLVSATAHARHIHGASGLDGADLPEPDRAALDAHAVDFLLETARAHAGELVVAAVGPLTNLALALRREPRLREWLAALTIMGGSAGTGNVTPTAEFNIHCDPEAAAIVFASGLPIHMVGLNVTREVGFGLPDLEVLREQGGAVGTALAGLLSFYLDRQRQIHGLEVAPMHDVCAVFAHTAPELITYEHLHVAVELNGALTRGMTVCDLRRRSKASTQQGTAAPAPNVHVAMAADGRGIIERVLATLQTYD